MKRYLKTVRIASIITIILFAGCKKDKNLAFVDENIIGHWMIENVTFKSNSGNAEIVIIDDVLSECQQDDNIEFVDGGKYWNWDSGETCVPTSRDEGTWDLRNGRTLRLNGFDYDLVSLKRRNFVIADSTEMNDQPGQIKLYFKRN